MASPRWVGSGRVVFNNKGKPVKQYEPFFSATHLYEDEAEVTETGVSPVLFYDPVGRVVATLHADHSYEKVTFDNWHQSTWDANDTSAQDPRTDADISGYVAKYFEAQPSGWQTWAARQSDATAVTKTQAHANTPAVAHLDSQGRVFLTLADNGTSKLASTAYDALNRPLAVTAPDGSVYRPTFNEANLLEAVDVKLRGASQRRP